MICVQTREAHDSHGDWSTCATLLRGVSRTFALPIEGLPDELRRPVTCGYLLCRVVDTIEDDEDLPVPDKVAVFNDFLVRLERCAGSLCLNGAFPTCSLHERELLNRVDAVFRVLNRSPAPYREAAQRWVREMVRGMWLYCERARGGGGIRVLTSMADLERYCFFVAGTVGHFLTECFSMWSGQPLAPGRRELAEEFGLGLQLTNILKDSGVDLQRGACFVPMTLWTGRDREGKPTDADLRPLYERARASLRSGAEYICGLANTAGPLRLFCTLPLIMAVESLNACEVRGTPFPTSSTKIGRDRVIGLVAECQDLCMDNDRIRRRVRC